MSPALIKKMWSRKLWIIPPILIGIAAIVLAPLIKSGPQETEVTERAVKVRAMKISELAVVPRAIGYGTVKPARTWEAVAEVAGQVAWVSDDLKNGHTVKAGAELLRIEDANYRLVLAQTEAQLQASDVKNKTTRTSLAITEKELALLRDDYKRKKGLAAKGVVSKIIVEAANRQMLGGESQVQNLKNSVALNTVERQVLVAQKASAELDLQRTHMIAPFDVRVTDVKIGLAQYANKGQLLFTADGLKTVEIEAQFPVGILRPLIGAATQGVDISTRQGALRLHAVVRLRTASHMIEWPARVDRVSGVIDPQTQSLGIIAAIDRPTDLAMPGTRPPLFRNTFVEVELSSNPIAGQIVVPVSALHEGKIYIIDNENRLQVRRVEIAFAQGGYAVLKKGVKAGERIVTSDLASAIEGMLLDPQDDEKNKKLMVIEATGGEPEK
ncbi:MAG: efflux RND transporter periplasmic adaptor subunit [Alphaproteobacteria bacterium]